MFGELEGLKAERPTPEEINPQKFVVCLIDTESERPQLIDTTGGLKEWYKLLKCARRDIQARTLDGVEYDFIFDDEAPIKLGAKVSALDKDGQPQLIGRLVICHCDAEGNETGLHKSDIEILKRHICILEGRPSEEGEKPPTWAAIYNLDN